MKELLAGACAVVALGSGAVATHADASPHAASGSADCTYNAHTTTTTEDFHSFNTAGGCSVSGSGGLSSATVSATPFVRLDAMADATNMVALDPRTAISARGTFDYYFAVTGGVAGTMVPVQITLNLFASASPATDANDADVADASVSFVGLSSTGVPFRNDGSVDACDFSPSPCSNPSSFGGTLNFMLASGATEWVHMTVLAAAGASAHGVVTASADPYIFVNPHFANASLYGIDVSSGVGNILPPSGAPEPEAWALMVLGLGMAGAAWRSRRRPLLSA